MPSMNTKNPFHSRGQKRFGSPQKLARNLILVLGIFYAGMMIISWEAHGHVTDAPVPIMKDLIPFSLNHYDYKYDYKTFHTPSEFKEEEEEEDNRNFFPVMDDYTVEFNNKQKISKDRSDDDYADAENDDEGRTGNVADYGSLFF